MTDQWTGKQTEEKDYSTYPKEKWCDYKAKRESPRF